MKPDLDELKALIKKGDVGDVFAKLEQTITQEIDLASQQIRAEAQKEIEAKEATAKAEVETTKAAAQAILDAEKAKADQLLADADNLRMEVASATASKDRLITAAKDIAITKEQFQVIVDEEERPKKEKKRAELLRQIAELQARIDAL